MSLSTAFPDARIRLAGSRRALATMLPHGRSLPADVWERRHRGVLWLLAAHAAALATWSLVAGNGPLHSAAHSIPIAGLALLAASPRAGRRLRGALASAGLVTASALIVHLSGGATEAHFHFFVVLAIIALYEDWASLAIAFALIVVDYGVLGALGSTGVYADGAALSNPWRWVAVDGVFALAAGVTSVVTWRLNETVRADIATSEHRAQASEERYRAIVESSSDAIVAKTLDGTVTSWNPAAERLYGYTADEILGTSGERVIPVERRAKHNGVLDVLWADEPMRAYETERLRRDGMRVPVSISLSPIRDAAGLTIGASEISRDISAQRASDAEREQLLDRVREQVEHLRSLDRMKDELIALVSHELRTPLTSIRGYLELILDGTSGDLSADQRQYLAVVARNAERLQSVVGDLLFVAQIAAGRLALELGDVDLAAVAAEAVEAGGPLARDAGIELALDAEPGIRLDGDRGRLGQLLDNLVSNAIKFTPAGGRVDVRVRSADGNAILEVADTGIGIPAAEQVQLFERFFRSSNAVENAIQGTGLGLTISKAIAEAHGGTVELASVEGEGTTIRIELPLASVLAAVA